MLGLLNIYRPVKIDPSPGRGACRARMTPVQSTGAIAPDGAPSEEIGVLAGVQMVHRAGDYALMRPGREMIYTTVDAESRYKAKNFIDTAVYRANDALSAWLVGPGIGSAKSNSIASCT